MFTYSIEGVLTSPGSTGYAELVEKSYRDRVRPLCMCQNPGIPMYIARFETSFIVKRMPDSGEQHAPTCEAYETPAGLSGRGEVEGSAIQEEEGGTTNVKLAFSLSFNGTAESPTEKMEHSSATAPGTKLTLRGFLHYLWEESGLSHWVPGMTGKRSWPVIRKYLLIAADLKETKRSPLSDLLYIPEFYNPAKASEIDGRKISKLSPIMGPGNAGMKKMVLIGEIDTLPEQARYGYSMRLKHLPGFPFVLSDELFKSFDKLFGLTKSLYTANPQGHLLTIATFTVDGNGVPEIQEIAIMLTNEQWIPVENAYDIKVVDDLIKEQRSFHKELRYNLAADKPIACATVTDVFGPPVALYLDLGNLVSKWASTESLRELMESSNMMSWVFDPRLPQPPFPPKHERGVNAALVSGTALNA
jgi:hypothetical protein